jgi:hypothetical protein
MWLLNLPVVLRRRLLLLAEGIGALLLLAGSAVAALLRGSGPVGARLAALLTAPAGQRRVFAVPELA